MGVHPAWDMWLYHFLGTYVIAGVTLAYALLALVRLRPRIRLHPKTKKARESNGAEPVSEHGQGRLRTR